MGGFKRKKKMVFVQKKKGGIEVSFPKYINNTKIRVIHSVHVSEGQSGAVRLGKALRFRKYNPCTRQVGGQRSLNH